MTLSSTIELTGVPVKTAIGVFASGDTDPYEHVLDLTIVVNPKLVLIEQDSMQHVFDYDPLLEQIHHLSQGQTYETQEILASRIVKCCASFKQIEAVEICLKKFRPDGLGGTVCGTIGVRLQVSGEDLVALR